MISHHKKDNNARFTAAGASSEDIGYIIKMRKRMTRIGYLLWLILGVFIYLFWSYLNWWLILLGIFAALILGGIVSFFTGKIVESKTGYDLHTQMKIYKNYQNRK